MSLTTANFEAIPIDPPMCRFGEGSYAHFRAYLSEGCVAFPDDRYQDLCPTHWRGATPHGTMCTVALYSPFAAEILEMVGGSVCKEEHPVG